MRLSQDADQRLPYGANHWAFFDYKGWNIHGNIINKRPV